jgi:hypothetical protein
MAKLAEIAQLPVAVTRKVNSGRLIEIASSGIDEYLQGVGGDPFGGGSSVGLRVPSLATPTFVDDRRKRYLFLAASFTVGEGAVAVIRGYRQLVTLGHAIPAANIFEELEVTSPFFRLPDGNVSWHLRRLGPPNAGGYPNTQPTPLDLPSFKKGWCDGPALLYQDYAIPAGDKFYTHLTSYTPPNGGQPWGTPPSDGQQGTFYDLRTPWRSSRAWSSLDMVVEGPDTIAMFISVKQSTGAYAVASTTGPYLSKEEQFCNSVGNGDSSPRPIYWRVGGSLIVEM